jgi:peptidoglycan hydrolase-like protein with peptidoglycan-binding domain
MEADDDLTDHGRLRRRRRILLAVVAIALLAAAGGLVISTAIKSPAQQAAQSRPPPLTRLTAPVRRQVITQTVLAHGAVTHPPTISGPAAAGGDSSPGAQPIVTRIFLKPGLFVTPGNPILEVAGRPVFVLQGTVPAYRDLAPGETGTDVAELQADLESLGYSVGDDTSGVFGNGTAVAVTDFYANIGYSTLAISSGRKADRGPKMPLSEFMFVPRLPARVVKLGAHVGGTASGSLVTLSIGSPVIAGQLNPGDSPLVRAGLAVKITDSATGSARRGVIRSVGRRTKTKGSISGGVYLPFKIATRRPLPNSLTGQDVTVTISAASSSKPVLAVPAAAVFASADGRTYVMKVTGAQTQVRVPVQVKITGDGLVGVKPGGGAALGPGDAVVTGEIYAQQAPPARRRVTG